MMNANFIDLGRFVAGLVSVVGLCLLIRFLRRRSPMEELIQGTLESGVHYGAAGVLIGYSFLPSMRLQFAESLILATAFFGGWFGFMAGSSLDLRILRRRWPALGLLEPVQAALLGVSIFLAAHAFSRIFGAGSLDLQGSVILTLCGICVAGKLHIGGGGGRRQAHLEHGIWPPALATFLGIVLVGLGTSQLRDVPFQIRQPFAAATRTIAVDGLAGEIFWSLVLGAVIGLVADLLIRGVDAGFLCYLLMGALMLGSGIAGALGLEPLWIGLVAGIWLINTTLRRLDILVVVERNHGLVQAGVYLVAGWMLGSGLARHQVDTGVLAWVLVLVGLLRPLVRLGFLQAAERIRGKRSLKNLDTGGLLDLDDLALVVAMGLMSILPAEMGLALLGAVMAGRFCLRPAGLLLQQFTQFGGRRVHSSPE
jgi:hypothetical protein